MTKCCYKGRNLLAKKFINKRFNLTDKFIVYDKPNIKQSYPHFRKYKKSGHPAMITSEYSKNEWNYKKVMHGSHDGRHLNDTIDPNPNPLDKKPMNVAKRVRHDQKNNFSTWRYNWKIRK
jgi:hypothetical protein